MEIIVSILCFLLTCIVGWWAIRSRREAINTRHQLDEVRHLREALHEAEKKRQP